MWLLQYIILFLNYILWWNTWCCLLIGVLQVLYYFFPKQKCVLRNTCRGNQIPDSRHACQKPSCLPFFASAILGCSWTCLTTVCYNLTTKMLVISPLWTSNFFLTFGKPWICFYSYISLATINARNHTKLLVTLWMLPFPCVPYPRKKWVVLCRLGLYLTTVLSSSAVGWLVTKNLTASSGCRP